MTTRRRENGALTALALIVAIPLTGGVIAIAFWFPAIHARTVYTAVCLVILVWLAIRSVRANRTTRRS